MKTKTCTKCRQEKPATLEHFYKHSASPSGLTPRCKPCVNEDNKAVHEKRLASDPERVRAQASARTMRHYRKNLEKSREIARLSAAKASKDPVKRAVKNMRNRGGGAGLTVSEFNQLLEKQAFKCAICRTDEPGTIGWNLDHDHNTGIVRGILCTHCNRGLGAYRDDITFIMRAAAYLGLRNGVLTGDAIEQAKVFSPFHQRGVQSGMSFGKSYAGYDIRIDQDLSLSPKGFSLASSMEYFSIPVDCVGMVFDKSSHARRGLSLFNTIAEPGWRGYLTLELFNASDEVIELKVGDPIAQVVFMGTEAPVERPYDGKYQDQQRGPQAARDEVV